MENWGPHRHLDCACEGRITGIVGGNGKGKSNLLNAIAYALTGDLGTFKGTDFIRNFGQADGAQSATVRLRFDKGGKEGVITRTVNAKGTSKRTLEWDGTTLGKAADVDAAMFRILGCDKDAVRNAVYIRQGEIDRLVRGTPAERHETYIKLLGLSGMEKRSEMVRKKSFALKAGIKDFSALDEMIEAERKQVLETVQARQVECEENAWAVEGSKWFGEVIAHLTTIRQLTAQHSQAVAAHAKASGEYETDLMLGGARREALQGLRDEIAQASGRLAAHEAYAKAVESRRALLAGRMEAEQKLAAAEAAAAEAGDEAEAKERLDELDTQLSRTLEALTYAVQGNEHEELARQRSTAMCNNLSAIPEKENALAKAEAELAKASERMHVAALCKVGGGVCPVCGGTVPEEKVREYADTFDKEARNAAQLENGIRQIRRELDALKQAHAKDLAEMTAEAGRAQQLHAQAQELAGSADEAYLRQLAHELSDTRVEALGALNKAAAAAHALQVACSHKEAYDKAGDTAIPEAPEGDAEAIRTQLAELRAREEGLRERAENHARLLERKNAAAETLARLYDSLAEWNASLDALAEKSPRPGILLHNLELVTEQADEAADALRVYNEANAVLAASQERLRELDERKRELATEKERNAKLVDLVEDLKAVADITSRNGVPLAFANEVFKSVHPVVAGLLSQMQANFTVEPDPERPLTYRFTRNDKNDGYAMKQERLSGGQAIRLAIATLLAAQRSILPEVGLLILDEPSSHVDADGVESMRDMFAGLAGLLENADMQLFVVDHNPDLTAAFNNLIKL